MQIGERGQVTIPLALRERFGLLPHTEVEFEVREGMLVVRKKDEAVRRQFDQLYGRKQLGKSTDELMRLLRDDE
jgi:AbrB family looped-hinge helix DNA binding protein